jgi:hypothetical protein
MRTLLGLLILGGLFLMAAAWQRNQTKELRAQRSQRYGIPEDPSGEKPGWDSLVLGRPSGAQPIPTAEQLGPAWESWTGPDDDIQGDARPPVQQEYRYEVQSGDVLSRICSQHYSTSRASLVKAVARYNGLSSPDAIRAGKILLLPDPGLLAEE